MKKNGFTLIEIIAVVAILGFLAIVAVPNVIKMFTKSTEDAMKIQEANVLDGANLYIEDYCRNSIDKSKHESCNSSRKHIFTYGDVNNDDRITASDGTIIKDYAVGTSISNTLAGYVKKRGDVNLNNKIEEADGTYVSNYVLGKETEIPEKVYFCILAIKGPGYLKDDIVYKTGIVCDGIITYDRVGRSYRNGKTYLKCGDNDYLTKGYEEYKSAFSECGISLD